MSEGSVTVDTMVTVRVSFVRAKTDDGKPAQYIAFPDIRPDSAESAWIAQWMKDAFGLEPKELDLLAVETGAAGVV